MFFLFSFNHQSMAKAVHQKEKKKKKTIGKANNIIMIMQVQSGSWSFISHQSCKHLNGLLNDFHLLVHRPCKRREKKSEMFELVFVLVSITKFNLYF